MRRWWVGTNSYHRTASYSLEEASWYIFALENTVQSVCDFLHSVPILNWSSPFGENHWSVATLFHCYVDMPVFGFCCDHIKAWDSPIDYDKIREKHPDMCAFMDEQEREDEEDERM